MIICTFKFGTCHYALFFRRSGQSKLKIMLPPIIKKFTIFLILALESQNLRNMS